MIRDDDCLFEVAEKLSYLRDDIRKGVVEVTDRILANVAEMEAEVRGTHWDDEQAYSTWA